MVIKKMSEIMDTNKQEDTHDATDATNTTTVDPACEQEKPVEVSVCNIFRGNVNFSVIQLIHNENPLLREKLYN